MVLDGRITSDWLVPTSNHLPAAVQYHTEYQVIGYFVPKNFTNLS
uniref:Uncharacterized protein n=1 Tax=Arundo donax TaxID=35708 RepID=A0A0A8ZYC3_ARUDO